LLLGLGRANAHQIGHEAAHPCLTDLSVTEGWDAAHKPAAKEVFDFGHGMLVLLQRGSYCAIGCRSMATGA
jgi:hypothetical protein